jgi:hypothetical protein
VRVYSDNEAGESEGDVEEVVKHKQLEATSQTGVYSA